MENIDYLKQLSELDSTSSNVLKEKGLISEKIEFIKYDKFKEKNARIGFFGDTINQDKFYTNKIYYYFKVDTSFLSLKLLI